MSEGRRPGDAARDANTALGAAIRKLRERTDLNEGELAARAGLGVDEISAIEAGELEPTWGDLRRIAAALGVPLPELLARSERATPKD
ncbi:MAG TPA: helix-turn-helix transcriptional regulator [Solirubrobacterales bacterium]